MARAEGGEVRWEHRQPATGGRWESSVSLAPHPLTELDPLGADVGTESPYEPGIAPAEPLIFDQGSHWGSRAGSPADPQSGCAVNGMGIPCDIFLRMVDEKVINFLSDDPRGGAGPYEAPVRRVGAGSTVWVDLGTRPAPGRGWSERAVGEGEVISSDITLRRMGFFIHLPVGGAALAPPTAQEPARVPLTGDGIRQYQEQRDILLKLLRDKNSACAKFLRETVGVSGTRIAKTVLGQRAFDAIASTISLENAGILPRGYTEEVGGMRVSSTMSVRDFFDLRIATAAQAAFARASTGATFKDVYYVPGIVTATTILHEALHTLLGLDDKQLERRKADYGSLGAGGCNEFGITYARDN